MSSGEWHCGVGANGWRFRQGAAFWLLLRNSHQRFSAPTRPALCRAPSSPPAHAPRPAVYHWGDVAVAADYSLVRQEMAAAGQVRGGSGRVTGTSEAFCRESKRPSPFCTHASLWRGNKRDSYTLTSKFGPYTPTPTKRPDPLYQHMEAR